MARGEGTGCLGPGASWNSTSPGVSSPETSLGVVTLLLKMAHAPCVPRTREVRAVLSTAWRILAGGPCSRSTLPVRNPGQTQLDQVMLGQKQEPNGLQIRREGFREML